MVRNIIIYFTICRCPLPHMKYCKHVIVTKCVVLWNCLNSLENDSILEWSYDTIVELKTLWKVVFFREHRRWYGRNRASGIAWKGGHSNVTCYTFYVNTHVRIWQVLFVLHPIYISWRISEIPNKYMSLRNSVIIEKENFWTKFTEGSSLGILWLNNERNSRKAVRWKFYDLRNERNTDR